MRKKPIHFKCISVAGLLAYLNAPTLRDTVVAVSRWGQRIPNSDAIALYALRGLDWVCRKTMRVAAMRGFVWRSRSRRPAFSLMIDYDRWGI